MSTTIRVSETTRRQIAELAAASGRQMQAIVDEAVLEYARSRFWESFEGGYQRLADDPDAWAEVQDERKAEAAALLDNAE
jgi:hypothetical protein